MSLVRSNVLKGQLSLTLIMILQLVVSSLNQNVMAEGDSTPPPAPTVGEVTDQSIETIGTAEVSSVVTLEVGEKVLGTAITKKDGTFIVSIEPQEAGTILEGFSTDKAGNVSSVTRVVVQESNVVKFKDSSLEEVIRKALNKPTGDITTDDMKELSKLNAQHKGIINGEDAPLDECFIATASFGTKFNPAVKLLREFRDEFLLTNELGQKFVKFYYSESPQIAQFIAGSEFLKAVVRVGLMPIVVAVYLLFNPVLMLAVGMAVITAFVLWKRRKE